MADRKALVLKYKNLVLFVSVDPNASEFARPGDIGCVVILSKMIQG
jgi:hypothetical protein